MDTEKALLYFNSANAYYLGARILMKPPKDSDTQPLSMVQPAVTCAALSLKLYFKCLLALEDNDSDDPMPLVALYERLKNNTRAAFLNRFDELSNSTMNSAELVKHIAALDDAFARWRFIHEKDAKSVNLEDLEEMVLALRSLITEFNPGWC
jgi:hypothetical protein